MCNFNIIENGGKEMNIIIKATNSLEDYTRREKEVSQGKCINCTYDWTTGQGCKTT